MSLVSVLVLDHGHIVQRGTHMELLAQGGLYREIYDLQLRDQEEFMASQIEGDSAQYVESAPQSTIPVDAR